MRVAGEERTRPIWVAKGLGLGGLGLLVFGMQAWSDVGPGVGIGPRHEVGSWDFRENGPKSG